MLAASELKLKWSAEELGCHQHVPHKEMASAIVWRPGWPGAWVPLLVFTGLPGHLLDAKRCLKNLAELLAAHPIVRECDEARLILSLVSITSLFLARREEAAYFVLKR